MLISPHLPCSLGSNPREPFPLLRRARFLPAFPGLGIYTSGYPHTAPEVPGHSPQEPPNPPQDLFCNINPSHGAPEPPGLLADISLVNWAPHRWMLRTQASVWSLGCFYWTRDYMSMGYVCLPNTTHSSCYGHLSWQLERCCAFWTQCSFDAGQKKYRKRKNLGMAWGSHLTPSLSLLKPIISMSPSSWLTLTGNFRLWRTHSMYFLKRNFPAGNRHPSWNTWLGFWRQCRKLLTLASPSLEYNCPKLISSLLGGKIRLKE